MTTLIAAKTNAKVDGSGTVVVAMGTVSGTAAGAANRLSKMSFAPAATVRLRPLGSAAAVARTSTPPCTVVPPTKLLLPESICVPLPLLTRLSVAPLLIVPENVPLPLFAPIVSVRVPETKLFFTAWWHCLD